MPLTKVKVNNLHTEVSTMIQNIAVDNSVDSAAVTSIVNTNIAAKSTSDISEGSNLYFTNERVDDRVAALVVGGNNITATYNDTAGTLTIDGQPGYTDGDVASYLNTNGYGTSSSIIGTITDNAPGTLDTLNELAAALGDDANFSTTVTNNIATKLPLAGGTMTGDISHSSNLVLDAVGTITLDADTQAAAGGVIFKDGGTQFGSIYRNSGHLNIRVHGTSSKDIQLGNADGITALTLDMGLSGTAIFNNDIMLPDNGKAIFGAGSDLQIYHDGTHSYVADAGGGSLVLSTNGSTVSINTDGPENMAIFRKDGSVDLFHNNSKKFETTSTGIDVTGTVTADGLTVDGDGTLQASDGAILNLKSTDTTLETGNVVGSVTFETADSSSAGIAAKIDALAENVVGGVGLNFYSGFGGSPVKRMTLDRGGDISFYEDTGTTAKFFWDASAERLGLGTSSPSQQLHISGTDNKILVESTDYAALQLKSGSTRTFNIQSINDSSGALRIYDATADTERMRIDSSGNLLVGTTDADPNNNSANTSADNGFAVTNNVLRVAKYNDNAAVFNRTGSDGGILQFRKSGSTVGGIGVSGTRLTVGSGGSAAGIRFDGAQWIPTISNVASDNGVDIGWSDSRIRNIYLSGSIANPSGDLTLDVSGDINLDADGSAINLKDGGTRFGVLYKSSNDFLIYSAISDGDMKLQGLDGSSVVTALTLDMSEAGAATFNGAVNIPGFIKHVGDDNTFFGFPSGDEFRIETAGAERISINGSATTFNEDGVDKDFRVESNNNTHALFVDGGADIVCFGTSLNTGLAVQNSQTGVQITSSGRIFCSNADHHDFNRTSNGDIIRFRRDTTIVGTIASTTAGTTYNTTSDRRLKDNIQPISDATDKLMDMKPVTHTWIDNPDKPQVHGFIAQEMQEVVPEAVTGDAESDEMMSMDYGRITPVIVAALQDALNEIKELKTRIDELENK